MESIPSQLILSAHTCTSMMVKKFYSHNASFHWNFQKYLVKILYAISSTDAAADYHQIRDADWSIQIFS